MASTNVITISELGIDYELPEGFSFNVGESHSYIDTLKELNRLPFSKGEIYYSDDRWDFSQYTTLNVQKSKLKFTFKLKSDALMDDAKNYVLIKALENKVKIQSIHRNFCEVKKFFDYVTTRNVYSVKDISVNLVKDYLQTVRDKGSIIALRFAKGVIKDFYLQYSANFEDIVVPGLMDLFEQDSFKAYKAHQEANKAEEIPQEYFDKFLSACITMLDDATLDMAYRGAAGAYIIMSQTGLRVGEILGLKTDALNTVTIFDSEEANYLNYEIWKRESGNNTATIERTFVNPLCKKAFLVLLEIYKKRRKDLKMDYLYMGGMNMKTAKYFPIDAEAFRRQSWRFLTKMDDLGLLNTVNLKADEYPMLMHASCKHQHIAAPKRFAKGTTVNTITYPDTQQFRFHVCTELHKKGLSLRYVQKFMGHLTFDMERYHVNPTTTPQEDIEYATNTLKEIVSGTTPLGEDKGLVKKIQEFIKENNFRVETDIDAICKALSEKIPIRQKTGGVCIKSSRLRGCDIDSPTNDFYCAYGVCPNIFHFYYMADITYRQCKELEESIGINKARNHKKQVQKESNMLYTIVTNRLVPEIEDLKRMVQKKGIEQIYREHPEVQDIVENMDTIEKEAQTWKSLKS